MTTVERLNEQEHQIDQLRARCRRLEGAIEELQALQIATIERVRVLPDAEQSRRARRKRKEGDVCKH